MKRNFFGQGMALLLAVILLLAGCAAAKPGDTTAAADVTTLPAPDQTTAPSDETTASVTGSGITFFSVNLNMNGTDNRYLLAYPNEDGTVYVEYVGDEKKIGTNMDAAVLDQIAGAMTESGIAALNNQNVYEDGMALGSAYVSYADDSMVSFSFTGTVPQEYVDAYEVLDACFQAITAGLEVYVPTPVVMGEVDEAALAELLQILEKTGIKELDTFSISDVLKDDAFAYVMGLSSADGVAVGTSCSAMMMTTPYSMVIATLEDGADAEAVRNDFINNLDWQKWVCVMPTDALVAQKGNMVLCLMGADRLYQRTAGAIADCGWDNIEAIDCPVG